MNILNQTLLKKEVFSHVLNPSHACEWISLFGHYYDKMNYITDYLYEIVTIATIKYANRSRDNADTWQTVHSSVYNAQDKTLNLNIQEDWNKTYTFEL